MIRFELWESNALSVCLTDYLHIQGAMKNGREFENGFVSEWICLLYCVHHYFFCGDGVDKYVQASRGHVG